MACATARHLLPHGIPDFFLSHPRAMHDPTLAPWEVSELEVRQHSVCGARTSDNAVNVYRNLGKWSKNN
jgi:hypothetical protein